MDKEKGFGELLAVCNQDRYCNPEFTESRFPLEPVADDEEDWEEGEHHFSNLETFKEGLRRLSELADKGEVRLLTGSRRAMNWVAAHPAAQLDHRVILPLRAQNSDGDWCLPVFYGDLEEGGHDLFLLDLDTKANLDDGWLVLYRKQAPAIK